MTADGKLTTNKYTLADLQMNTMFFRICERLTVIALAGYCMKSIKMPHNKCFQNFIIFIFVATRISITIWGLLIVDNIVKLIIFCVKSTWKDDTDPKVVKNDSRFNNIICWFVYIFTGLFALAVIGLIAVCFVAFINNVRNSHLPLCEAICEWLKSFGSTIYELLSNWIYPEHILNHTAFTHDLVDENELARLNNQFAHEDKVEGFIE